MDLLRAWAPIFEDQKAARNAAGWAPATGRERWQTVARYTRLKMWRARGYIPPVRHVDGYDHGFEALAYGGPVIVAFPHVGPFEAAAALLADAFPERAVTIITDSIQPGTPARTLQEQYGWTPVTISDEMVGDIALQTLLDGDILAVSTDVMPDGQKPVAVDFLRRLVDLPAGPADLALATGAAVLPVASYFAGRKADIVIGAPIWLSSRLDRYSLTQEIADAVGGLICRAPDQWFPPWPLKRAGIRAIQKTSE